MHKPNDNQPCPHCGRFKNRGIAIDALILREDKILLIKRKFEPFKGFWALPGGYLEWNEDLNATIKREVKEETNLDVTSAILSSVYSDPKRDPKQTASVAYLVTANGEIAPGDDASQAKWFDLDNLPELAFDHEKIINDTRR